MFFVHQQYKSTRIKTMYKNRQKQTKKPKEMKISPYQHKQTNKNVFVLLLALVALRHAKKTQKNKKVVGKKRKYMNMYKSIKKEPFSLPEIIDIKNT